MYKKAKKAGAIKKAAKSTAKKPAKKTMQLKKSYRKGK